jgi:hypothetical protein
MKIEARITYRNTGEEEIRVMNVDDGATLANLLEHTDLKRYATISVDHSCYYEVLTGNLRQGRMLPYLAAGYRVSWSVPYQAASIREFLDTHAISDNRISFQYYSPAAGGPGWIDVLTAWNRTYEALTVFNTLGGSLYLTHLAMRRATIIIKAKMGRRRHKGWNTDAPRGLDNVWPGSVFSFIATRAEWNASELADRMGTTKDVAKDLLKSVGYRFDRQRQMFVTTANTEEAFKVVTGVRWIPDTTYLQRRWPERGRTNNRRN